MSYCTFKNLLSSAASPCFYMKNSNLSMQSCCVYKCQSTTDADETPANGFFCENMQNVTISNLNIFQVGEKLPSCDSAVCFKQSITNIKYVNASSCEGVHGCSSIAFRSAVSATTKYFVITDPSDYDSFEIWYNPVEISEFIIMNSSNVYSGIFWSSGTQLTLIDSIIVGCKTKRLVEAGTVYMKHCYCDSPHLSSNDYVSPLQFDGN